MIKGHPINKVLLSCTVFVLAAIQTYAQAYFQQEVNYKIDVRLNDEKHELSAGETIEYTNNSSDELKEIYMHLWPNAYKNNNTALARQLLEHGNTKLYYATPQQRGFIDSLDFRVNGQSVKWEYDAKNIDICKLILNQPLKPGEKLTISTPFHVKIPEGIFSRLGHLDQAYQVTQWYPKPAVYDKLGWHAMPYLNQGEFYSEFGSFDVSITVPKNYVVGATGDMADGEQELAWLNNKVKETEQIKEFSKDMSCPASDKAFKTLHFKQTRVHDFAWFADKRFHVLKGEVELPHTKRKVTTWVMFTNSEPELWKKSIAYMNEAVYYYSLWNGDYPYNHATAVDGALTAGAGMEYPNITVIGPSSSDEALESVIIHEVGHNWFYGILGSNERRYPWMDEGINSFYEHRCDEMLRQKRDTVKSKKKGGLLIKGNAISGVPFGTDRVNYRTAAELEYALAAARHSDQPLDLPAEEYTELNYGCDIYAKTPLCFDYLKAYLGDGAFDKAMQAYFEKWKFKHPYPADLRAVLEESTGKNLDWFFGGGGRTRYFNGLINSNEIMDYKILSSHTGTITLKNTGGIAGPVPVTAFKDGEPVVTKWYEGFDSVRTLNFPAGNYDYYRIDADQKLPEINRQNNTLRTHGVFKRIEPLRLQFLYASPNPERTVINYAPVIGWNNYNKTMVGAAFYNNFLPQKPVEYMVMPMYGTGSNTLAGGADLGWNFANWFWGQQEHARLGITGERYAYMKTSNGVLNFNKLSPSLVDYFVNNTHFREMGVRMISVYKDDYTRDMLGNVNGITQEKLMYTNVFMTIEDKRAINPWRWRFDDVSCKDFTKLSLAWNYKINYAGNSKKGVEIRAYGGYSVINDPLNPSSQFSLSGFNGNADYLYDGVFLGRSETDGKLSHQFMETEGAFKTDYTRVSLSPTRNTRDYIATLNVKVPSPGGLPIGIFGSIGTFKDVENIGIDNKKYLYEAGFYADFGQVCQVYFPLPFMLSDNLKAFGPGSTGGPYSNYIRFTFNLASLMPFNLVKQIPY